MSLSKKAAQAKKPAVKKSIMDWLTKQADEGNELCMKWEGGGDSGWCYFEVDGHQEDNEYTEALVEYMYSYLDYGSWAGEFNAQGTAVYNPKTKCFEGTDYYSEDAHTTIETEIKISIPKSFWFDTFHIEVESNYDESPNVSARFLLKNGFLTQQHEDFCHNLEEVLTDDFENLFDKYESSDDHDFRGCNDSWIINRTEFTEEGDNLVYTIQNVEVQTTEGSEKDVVLVITDDMVKDINDSLNA